jgi:hypothetical protein
MKATPLQHTPGPWAWFTETGPRPYLATPNRGRLYVMGFSRSGMQGATPIFSHWNGIEEGTHRGRSGGIMHNGIFLPNGAMHPDARVIQTAPQVLRALRALHDNMVAQDLEDQNARPTEEEYQLCMRDAAAALAEADGVEHRGEA